MSRQSGGYSDPESLPSPDSTETEFQSMLTEMLNQKLKVKQDKFLKHAEREIQKETDSTLSKYNSSVKTIESVYSKFLASHATQEDKIQRLWEEIQHRQDTLVEHIRAIHRKVLSERIRKSDDEQLQGMKKIQLSFSEYQKILEALPDLDDD